MYQPAYNS